MQNLKQNKIVLLILLIFCGILGILPKNNDLGDIINKAIENVRNDLQGVKHE